MGTDESKLKKNKTPFTDEQVLNLNKFQNNKDVRPFTCNGEFCDKKEMIAAGFERSGLLLATKDGLICPCGKYSQKWAYEYMTLTKSTDSLINV